MTVYLVECSGGQYEDWWQSNEGIFSSKELADEFIVKRKQLFKQLDNDHEVFNRMFDALCDEIDREGPDKDGVYFNPYGPEFDSFINKLESYKSKNEVIRNFLEGFSKQYVYSLYDWYIGESMHMGLNYNNVSFSVIPMHVNNSLLEVSDKLL